MRELYGVPHCMLTNLESTLTALFCPFDATVFHPGTI